MVVTFYHVCRRRLPACWERILFNLDGFSHLTITPCHLQHQKTSYLWVPHSYPNCTQIRRSCLKYANCSSLNMADGYMQALGVLGINQLRQQKLSHLSIGIKSSSKVIKVNEVKNNYWVSKEIEYKNILRTQYFIRCI